MNDLFNSIGLFGATLTLCIAGAVCNTPGGLTYVLISVPWSDAYM